MPKNYRLKRTDANPPENRRRHDRLYHLKEANGKHSLITLRYHVWTEEGIPKDAYEVLGTTRVLSYYQVQQYIRQGILTPLDGQHNSISELLIAA